MSAINRSRYVSPSRIFKATASEQTVKALYKWRYGLLAHNDNPQDAVNALCAPARRGERLDELAQSAELRKASGSRLARMMDSYLENDTYVRTILKSEVDVYSDKYKIKGRYDAIEKQINLDTGELLNGLIDWKTKTQAYKIRFCLQENKQQLGAYSLTFEGKENKPDFYRLVYFPEDKPVIIHTFTPEEIAESSAEFMKRVYIYNSFPIKDIVYCVLSDDRKQPIYELPDAMTWGRETYVARKRVNPMHEKWCNEMAEQMKIKVR